MLPQVRPVLRHDEGSEEGSEEGNRSYEDFAGTEAEFNPNTLGKGHSDYAALWCIFLVKSMACSWWT